VDQQANHFQPHDRFQPRAPFETIAPKGGGMVFNNPCCVNNMRQIATTLMVIVFVVISLFTTQAQVSGAAISLVCEDMEVEDFFVPGNATLQCIISNPTAYVERVSVNLTENQSFTHEFLEDFEVGAGQQVSFSINVSWMGIHSNEDSNSIGVTAHVEELNNLPPPNTATSTATVDVHVNNQACTTEGTTDAYIVELMIADLGRIVVALNYDEAPIHAMNFAILAGLGCYDNTSFHRVIDGFVVQGGDFTNGDGTGGHASIWSGYCNGQPSTDVTCGGAGQSAYTIPDETNNLSHTPYVISMAKTSAPNTAGSQFFIVTQNSTPSHLDGVHTVFGRVVEGFSVVDSIEATETGAGDKPVQDIVIEWARLLSNGSYDIDGDSVIDHVDNCPSIVNPSQNDTDGDGMGDKCDSDDDNDGVGDEHDQFPFDSNESADLDGDGIGDNADPDDDGDGMNDTSDAFPNDPNETTDTDGDGIGDNGDADDDGDGVADTTDNCPYTANPDQADADNDGIGTACDGSEDETETPAVPALGLMATMLAICLAVGLRKFD